VPWTGPDSVTVPAALREKLVLLARGAALDATGDGVLVVDATGRLLDANAAARRALDIPDDIPGTSADTGAPGAFPRESYHRLLTDPNCHHLEFAAGPERIFEAWITSDEQHAALNGIRAVLIRDVTARRRDERRLLYLAHHDSLTGLPNRYRFVQQFSQAVREAKAKHHVLALFYIDLDRFKEVNDSLGHAAGDKLLCIVAQRFRARLRADDLVALDTRATMHPHVSRLAGDEFALVVPDIGSPELAGDVAKRILQMIAEPVRLEGRLLVCSGSVGIAILPNDGDDVDRLANHADIALYAAKQRGRNRYEFYRPSLSEETDRTREIQQELHGAIERGELRLHYQPKVNLASSTVTGFEALLRWRNRRLGTVGPAEFIPVAERSGLIGTIGSWCLYEACRQLRAWRDEGLVAVPVAVNVSSAQFVDGDLYQVTTRALESSAVEPRLLELELTESRLLEDNEATATCLRDLRAIGIRIALDDFGTGYSSLTYLNRIPLDTLKMDRRFFREIEFDPVAVEIVSSVVAMGHALKLSVVAEGVDSESQLDQLREMLCDQVQGFVYSPALPPSDVRGFLASAGCPPPLIEPGGKATGGRGSRSISADSTAHLDAKHSRFKGPRRVLVLDDADRTLSALALRLMRLGIDAQCVASTEEAKLLIDQEKAGIRLLVVAPTCDLVEVSNVLRHLAIELGGVSPVFLVVGEQPDAVTRARIRAAGARWVLWAPIDDSELRFMVNSSMALPYELALRRETRVPVNLLAVVRSKNRHEAAVISNLSLTGAFIEMPDPPPVNASIRIEFDLPNGRFEALGRVRHRHLEAPNLPVFLSPGAGVLFDTLSEASESSILEFIEERAARYLP